MDKKESAFTHFGFTKVAKAQKHRLVADVFNSVANSYDLMNDLMSFGVHRLWKSLALEVSGARLGQRVLDMAGGTGDMAARLAKIVGSTGEVVLADINANMLHRGRDRLLDQGAINVRYVQANAEILPFERKSFDLVTIAFGLRNVTDKAQALRAFFDVLKPRGKLLILEFSKPTSPWFSKLYDLYSFKALPFMGRVIARDAKSYRYLAESIRMHPDQEKLLGMLQDAGFVEGKYYNMTAGVVALHSAVRP